MFLLNATECRVFSDVLIHIPFRVLRLCVNTCMNIYYIKLIIWTENL